MRPSFLSTTAICAAFVACAGGLFAETESSKAARAAYRANVASQQRLAESARLGFLPAPGGAVRRLSETAGVQVMRASRPLELDLGKPVTCGPVNETTSEVVEPIARELARYPSGTLRRAGLEQVVMCRELREAGLAIPSLPNVGTTLLLDIAPFEARLDARPAGEPAARRATRTVSQVEFLRRLIHHEVFHFIDFADDKNLAADVQWSGVNPKDFVYSDGGRAMRNPDASLVDSAIPGFVTRYATSALEEDKAELFSVVLTQPRIVHRMSQTDPVLRRKLAVLRTRVAAFDPTLSELLHTVH